MNGASFSKKINESGQVLLLLIMVLGTLLVVAMTAIFQSTNNTQISSINQVSQITLAAAEAGIEKALQSNQSGSFAELGLTNLNGINLNESRVEIVEERSPTFLTPRMEEDEQYTFYLSEYSNTFPYFGQSYALRFQIFYESGNPTCTDVALEMTVVYDDGNDNQYESAKLVSDAGNLISPSGTPATIDLFQTAGLDETIGEYAFQCRTSMIDTTAYENPKFIFVQNYFRATKVAFAVEGYQSTSPPPAIEFPPQGKTVTATARYNAVSQEAGPGTPTPAPQTGLTRQAEIFQSYPQIPAELWVTSF